jgi:hypothetical protein
MRTIGAAIVGVTALGLLLGSSISLLAQSMDDERNAIKAHIAAHSRGSILVGTPVLDSPFTGDAETTWRPPSSSGTREVRATARYYRDRAGRIRVEQTFVGHTGRQGPQRIVVTPDLNLRWAYVLDPAARTAMRISRTSGASVTSGGAVHFMLPVSMTCDIALFRPGLHTPLEEESLGERTMDGVRVEGTRVRSMLNAWLGPGDTIDERWFSPELKLEMYGRSEDDQIGVVEYRVTPISRAEPSAELFEVPAGYDLAAPFRGMTSLNPYAPEIWPTLSPSVKSLCGSKTPPGF